MRTRSDPNIELVRTVAERLGPLRERVVFLGGAAAGLLITDPAAEAIRPTDDVDVVVEVASLIEYQVGLRDQLLGLGFSEDLEEGAPICRWRIGDIKVDIMPTEPSVLGFSNRWYPSSAAHAERVTLPTGPEIRLVAAPYFLATKLEAFRGRGGSDFLASHDLEDIVAVVDGRAELPREVSEAKDDVREFLATEVGGLLANRDFQDALPGHLRGDPASQARVAVVLGRMEEIAKAMR